MNTILYINPLLEEIHFLIFQGEDTIQKTLPKNLDTASTFPRMLSGLVDLYGINEIWCITGPGPFTLMRVITLAINAITYTRTIQIKSCHFFELIRTGNIAIIEANPREYLIKNKNDIISIEKELLGKGTYEGIISSNPSTENIKYIQYLDDRSNLIQIFSNTSYEKKIIPIYFKPPRITC